MQVKPFLSKGTPANLAAAVLAAIAGVVLKLRLAVRSWAAVRCLGLSLLGRVQADTPLKGRYKRSDTRGTHDRCPYTSGIQGSAPRNAGKSLRS